MEEETSDSVGRAGGPGADPAIDARLLLSPWAEVSPSVRVDIARAAARALAEETTAALLGEPARGR